MSAVAAAAPALNRGARIAAALAAAAVLATGVLALDWPVLAIMLLFWLENVVVGAFNVLKMLSVGIRAGVVGLLGALSASAFFTVHYGLFCFVHGIFVVLLFSGGGVGGKGAQDPGRLLDAVIASLRGDAGFAVALAVLVVVQVIDFVEWRIRSAVQAAGNLLFAPYGRIVVLHVTLLAGAALIARLGTPVAGVLLLIGLKLAYDLVVLTRRPRTV